MKPSDPIWGGILLLNLFLSGAITIMVMYYEKWGIIEAPVPVVEVGLFLFAYCFLSTLPLSYLNESWKAKRRK